MPDNSPPPLKNTESNEASKPASLHSSITSNSAILGIFALLCTAIIAGTYLNTADNIADQKRQAQLKALYQIVPRKVHDNDMLKDNITLKIGSLGHRKTQTLFLATKDRRPLTLIYPVTARDGYSGDINFIIGVNINDASISGVRVISHKETPGLGDKIDLRKSDWILDFNGRSLSNPDSAAWTVKKDGGIFDGFTGATITPRAVTTSIATALRYHHQNVGTLLQQFNPQAE